jgi:hypothetical protein
LANATPSRIGQVNNAGDAKALFLKVFAGEVLTAFAEANVTADKHLVRTITQGKSAQIPILGKIGAEYHTPGAEITGLNVPANEQIITIDDLLISHAFIASIDEAMNHYDVRSPYSTEMGRALAYAYDKHILQLAVLAARGASPVNTEAGGGSVADAALLTDTTGEKLVAAIFAAAQKLDENSIPSDDRFFFLKPSAYYMLAQNTKLMNSLWGGEGSFARAELPTIAGFKMVKTIHSPFGSNIAAGSGVASGTGDKYAVNATNTVGVAMHKAAVGTVKLLDLAMESDYDIRRQGTLMVGKYAMGHGVLRPAAAVELKTA